MKKMKKPWLPVLKTIVVHGNLVILLYLKM
jgi:hypothetical protein